MNVHVKWNWERYDPFLDVSYFWGLNGPCQGLPQSWHPVSDYQPVTRVKKTQHSPSFFLFRLEGALLILAMNRFAARSLTENSLPKLYILAQGISAD